MKTCAYCGRENDDTSVVCRECGTGEFKTTAPAIAPAQTPSDSFEFLPLAPEDKEKELVTLMRCRTLLEADMVVAQLDSAGIPAFIPDQFLMQSIGWNVNTYGYVRVQVPGSQHGTAKEFLLAARLSGQSGFSSWTKDLPARIDESINPRSLTAGNIEFLLVFVRADTAAQIGERMGLVADIGVEHGAIVHDLVSSLVVLGHGTLPVPSGRPFSRASLVQALQHQLGSNIKIVYGGAKGHFGNFGSATRFSFTFSIPRFDAALALLGKLAFGETEEFKP